MDTPLITAVIPTYQRPHLLKRAVCSVLGQSFPHFEVLIADNASGKQTDQVILDLMQCDTRVKVLKHEKNIGAIRNFQSGLMSVSTPYVCFLPDDDFFAPFYFKEVVSILQQNPECAFAGGGGVIMDNHYCFESLQTAERSVPPSGYYSPPKALFVYLESSFNICFPSLLFKTAVLKKLGGFDLRIRNGADEYLVSQCAARYPVYLITDRPFYFAFHYENNLSSQLDFQLFENEAIYLQETLLNTPLTFDQREKIEIFFTKRMQKILSNAYRHFCAHSKFVEAGAYAAKLAKHTGSSRWKLKQAQSRWFEFFPFTAPIFRELKNLEKKWRHSRKKTISLPEKQPEPPQNVDELKDYVISLEKKAKQLLVV